MARGDNDLWVIFSPRFGWLMSHGTVPIWSGLETAAWSHWRVRQLAETFATGTAAYLALDAAGIDRAGCEAILLMLE